MTLKSRARHGERRCQDSRIGRKGQTPLPGLRGHTESPENSPCRLGAGPPVPDSSPQLPRVSAESLHHRAALLGAEEALGSKGKAAKGTPVGGLLAGLPDPEPSTRWQGDELGAGGTEGHPGVVDSDPVLSQESLGDRCVDPRTSGILLQTPERNLFSDHNLLLEIHFQMASAGLDITFPDRKLT